ncbi:MAG TPA: DUF2867 domain-containing protein [Anaeromyxobacter sp.]
MRIDPAEFRARPLRVHTLLHDVPLEDVWAIRLRGGGPGRTIADLGPMFSAAIDVAPAIVKALFRLRVRMGALFGWDRQRPEWSAESYVHRLTRADRARSTAAPGTPDGRLSLVYRFEDEQLSEKRNGTVHAFSSLSMRPAEDGYLAYWAIYVRPVHRFTRLYMRAIDPFRRLLVYPAIIREVESAWAERYRGAPIAGGAAAEKSGGASGARDRTRAS